jgi:hypothetical protein
MNNKKNANGTNSASLQTVMDKLIKAAYPKR